MSAAIADVAAGRRAWCKAQFARVGVARARWPGGVGVRCCFCKDAFACAFCLHDALQKLRSGERPYCRIHMYSITTSAGHYPPAGAALSASSSAAAAAAGVAAAAHPSPQSAAWPPQPRIKQQNIGLVVCGPPLALLQLLGRALFAFARYPSYEKQMEPKWCCICVCVFFADSDSDSKLLLQTTSKSARGVVPTPLAVVPRQSFSVSVLFSNTKQTSDFVFQIPLEGQGGKAREPRS
jgi:hypothetical protein